MRRDGLTKPAQARQNIAKDLLRHHVRRPRLLRAANDNRAPIRHMIKASIFWAAIVALTAMMVQQQLAG